MKNIRKSHESKILPHLSLLFCAVLILPFLSFSQTPGKKVILDGTEGEVLEVIDTSSTKKSKKSWNVFNLGFTTLRIGGGFLLDYATYTQDQDGEKQMDTGKLNLSPGFKVRDSRIAISGQFKTKRTITWKAGFMYDGAQDAWFMRETGIMVAVPELWGNIFVGRTKEGVSMSKVMNGYSGEMIERYMACDPIPILADGIKWLGYMPKTRIFWNIGVFANWTSKNESFSTYKSQFASRIGWLAINTDRQKLHIAGNFRIGAPYKDSIRIRSKPEASDAPYFIDAGKFASDKSTYSGGEIYYSSGPLIIGTEYFWDRFSSPSKNNPVFNGGEIVTSYIFTGEMRPYNTIGSIYGFVPVNRSVFKGGPGAWEAVLRFSSFNLNDGLIAGGKFWRITPQLNWYLANGVRFELVYGYGILDRFNIKGATQFFQSRIQFSL